MPAGTLLPHLLLSLLVLQVAGQEGGTPPTAQDTQDATAEAAPASDEATTPEPAATNESAAPIPTEQDAAWLAAVGPHWLSLDDPGAHTLPDPLLRLSGERQALFESASAPRLLMIRSLPDSEVQIDGFVADEGTLSLQGEFIPVEDRAFEGPNGPTTAFDCEWTYAGRTHRVAAMYIAKPDGLQLALWIVAADDAPFAELHTELEATGQRFIEGTPGATVPRYRARLNAHEVAFNLGAAPDLALLAEPTMEAEHGTTTRLLREANPSFLVSEGRQWANHERGLSLSYQIIQKDVGFGPTDPFMYWVAGVFQSALRGDIDLGDAPRELIHLDQARTEFPSDEAIAKHYENCKRTRDSGVILEVLLPRSPFARVCRMSWSRPQEGEPNFFGRLWFVELRHYHPGRGETVTGASVVILRAHARSQQELDLLESSLDFRSSPIAAEGRFPLGE